MSTAQACLHSALSVLMNVSHNNRAGCELVASAGGLEAAAEAVAHCVGTPPAREGAQATLMDRPPPAFWFVARGARASNKHRTEKVCAERCEALSCPAPPVLLCGSGCLRRAASLLPILGLLVDSQRGGSRGLDQRFLLLRTERSSRRRSAGSSGLQRARLLESIDVVSVGLGLLINVAECCPGSRARMAAIEVEHGSGSGRAEREGLVPLLCRLVRSMHSSQRRCAPFLRHRFQRVPQAPMPIADDTSCAASQRPSAVLVSGTARVQVAWHGGASVPLCAAHPHQRDARVRGAALRPLTSAPTPAAWLAVVRSCSPLPVGRLRRSSVGLSPAGAPRASSSDEVTVEQLELHEQDGAASIVEVGGRRVCARAPCVTPLSMPRSQGDLEEWNAPLPLGTLRLGTLPMAVSERLRAVFGGRVVGLGWTGWLVPWRALSAHR
jgi:hypothetical protein